MISDGNSVFQEASKTSAMVNTQVNIKDFFNLLISLKYLGLFKTKLITLSYGDHKVQYT